MDEAVDFMEREDTASREAQLGSKYLIGAQIGRGAMGVVYSGSTREGDELAVKILRPELSSDAKTVSRFIQERHIFSRVDHPNVVRVHDLVAEGDRLGIVMERVSGGDLKARIEEGGVTPTQAVRIAASIADGLEAIHGVDVIHRDLKPANILLTTDADGRLMPKISDFGISRLVSEAMTRTSTTIGTPLYMAPESADQRGAGPASDVYALGAMLFEMLTGMPPFHSGGTFAVLRAHALDAPARVNGVPTQLADLIDAMLAKEPSHRPTVQAVRQTLLQLLPQMDDGQRPFSGTAAPTNAAGATAAAATAAAGAPGVSGGAGDSSETVIATNFTGPNDSSETVIATNFTGPNDSSETVVSSPVYGAGAGAALGAAGAVGIGPATPMPPAHPAGPPPLAPGPASPLAGGPVASGPADTGPTAGSVGGYGAISTSNRAFDRVPRRVLEVGAVLATVAAVALVGFFVLRGGDDGGDVAVGQILAGDSDIDPASGGVTPESGNNNAENARGEFANGSDGASDGDDASSNGGSGGDGDSNSGGSSGGDNNGTTATTEDGRTGTTAKPKDGTETTVPGTTEAPPKETTTTERPTTTTEKPTTTTEKETTTTEKPTTTTEKETTTQPEVTTGPVLTPIAIVSGPSVNSVSATSFQFNYSTNGVCGSGSFRVVRASDGVVVGSFSGDGSCYGPLHGGFPSAGGGPPFGGMNIEPNTKYTVTVTVRGTLGATGSLVDGTGSDSRSFSVTTGS